MLDLFRKMKKCIFGAQLQMSSWLNQRLEVGGQTVLFGCTLFSICQAAGLPLPKRLVAHGWWTKDGMKISKSLGVIALNFPALLWMPFSFIIFFFKCNCRGQMALQMLVLFVQ